ncbi:TonB-dependent receptor [Sphingomonas sp. HMWF008]|nr:TonB-dependent receptor [Sphingomonas sp. HMWF008]
MGRWGIWSCAVALAAPCPPAAFAQTAPETAPQAAASQAVLVYPASFFASSNPGTALDMIQRLPGFTLDVGDLDSRGLSGASSNVLIDGSRPSSKSDNVAEVLSRITAASVERIELIRGGAPGIDMRGRALVANVIVKRAPKTELVAEGNSYIYDDGEVGPVGKLSYTRRNGDRVTEASLYATDDRGNSNTGTRLRTTPSGLPLQAAALGFRERFADYTARASIQRPFVGGKLQANVVLDYFRQRDTQTTRILAGPGDDERVDESSRYPNGEAGFTWTRERARSTFELTGLQRLNRNTYRGVSNSAGSDSVFTSRATGGESVLRATDSFRPGGAWSFEGGGEIAYNFLDSRTAYAEGGVAVPLPNAAVRVSELRGEGFAQAIWKPASKLTIDGTLRVEVSRISQTGDFARSRGFVFPKPKLLVTWLPGEGHQLRFRLEQEVDQLNFGDFAASSDLALGTISGGNADLRPSHSIAAEAVYERRFWKKGVFELTARHTELFNVIDSIPLTGGFNATGNIGHARSDVIKAALTLPFDRLGLKDGLLKLSSAYRESRVTDPLTGQPRRLSYQQAFECHVGFTQDVKGGRFQFGFAHGCEVARVNSYRIDEVRTGRGPPFASVYGQWKPKSDLTLRLDLGNLVNGSSATLRDVYAGPRDVSPLLFREERATRRGRYAYLQVRKVL